MTAIPSLLLLVATVAPPAEVSTLNGEQKVGTLERVTADEVVLKSPTGSTTIPARELLSIRIAGIAPTAASGGPSAEVRLTDGTRLRVTSFTSAASQATLTHPQLGSLKLPLTSIQSIRFAAPDSKVDAAWNQLLDRSPKKDQVAIRKNDLLDHLDGVIGSMDETTLNFQLDGDDIPVKRERVFGLIYSKRESTAARTSVAVELTTGDRLAARSVTWDMEVWKVRLASGSELSVPASGVQTVDFSLGKIAYLSNLEPRDVKYTPFFDFVWEYRRDRSFDGRPISVGNKTYPKGLAIHSATVLKYRIGGDYRRFQAVMGIDDDVRVAGNVDVVIKGDNRVLFSGSARLGQPPQPLDLDVAGIVELEITVGFGDDQLDIADRLHLADAKLIK